MSEQEIEGGEAHAVEVVEVDEEQDDIYPPLSVQREQTVSVLKSGLECIGKISSGKNHAYVHLNCEKKKIRELFDILEEYKHLRVINLSKNWLTSVSSVSCIKYLTHLNLSNNRITSLDAFIVPGTLTFLEELNLSGNRIRELIPLEVRNLLRLDLSSNEITTCENFTGHHSLQILQLKKNKLTHLKGISNMRCLEQLYAAENPITDFSHLHELPHLKRLHLRKTEIKSLSADMPQLPLLNYLNLRESKLDDLKQMKLLTSYKSLSQLNVLGTEMADNTEYNLKEELIMLMPQLTRINKEVIEQEEVTEALSKLKDRIQEQERLRIEEEEKRKEEEEERLKRQEEGKNEPQDPDD